MPKGKAAVQATARVRRASARQSADRFVYMYCSVTGQGPRTQFSVIQYSELSHSSHTFTVRSVSNTQQYRTRRTSHPDPAARRAGHAGIIITSPPKSALPRFGHFCRYRTRYLAPRALVSDLIEPCEKRLQQEHQRLPVHSTWSAAWLSNAEHAHTTSFACSPCTRQRK